MNLASLQTEMRKRQQLCFSIISVINGAESPITIEMISHKIDRAITNGMIVLLIHLVGGGFITSQLIDGTIHYAKSASTAPHLPLPYHVFDLYPDDFSSFI